jgi:hypothetical protein
MMYHIKDWEKTIFQSYNSIICIIERDKNLITFWRDYDYSKTTWKHLNLFLKEFIWLDECNRKLINKWIKDWQLNNWYIDYSVIYDENIE